MADGRHASDDSGGYVHDPEAFREGEAAEEDEGDDADPDAGSSPNSDLDPGPGSAGPRETVPRNDPPPGDGDLTVPERECFGLRGWVLVGALLIAFLVVPAVIVFVPPAALPFEVAFLILPLLPALLLGALAVWSALGGAA
jgi:hypothetical protein